MSRKLAIGAVIIVLALGAGGAVLWLANSDMMPPSHAVEQTIPDEQIPR